MSKRTHWIAAVLLMSLAMGCHAKSNGHDKLGIAALESVECRLQMQDGSYGTPSARMEEMLKDLPQGPDEHDLGSVTLSVLDDMVAYGDVDGDGHDDAVVVVASEGVANATFYDLAVVAMRNGRAVNIAS